MIEYKKLQTPCFLLKEQELRYSIQGFQDALANRFGSHIIGYSVKTNSLPYCLAVACQMGCYAEVVSYHEYGLARKCGFDIDKIIYNGPMKSKETFMEAIIGGAIVNIETHREIEWLGDLPKDKVYNVGIRLNINISTISPDDENHPDDDSRFGFSDTTDEFSEALSQIKVYRNVRISGIHTHRTSRTRSLAFYQNVIKYTQSVLSKYDIDLDYWDLGGGYFGIMPGKPSYDDYASAMYEVMDERYRNLTIIVEPGNALVASAFDYVSRVIDVKRHDENVYVTTDGTRNDIVPFFRKTDYFKEYLMHNESEQTEQPQIVSGLTCLEYDRLFEIPAGGSQLSVDDLIVYHRVGAYTMCLTPLFIHYFPTVFCEDVDGNVKVIRSEWSEQEYLNKNII